MNERDRREGLRIRIEGLLAESGDVYFSEYLRDLHRRLMTEGVPVEILEEELARNHSLYRQRMSNIKAQGTGRNVEYTLGVVSLGLMGSLFLLISFVILGMNFMNGFIKGMSLYGLVLLLIIAGELICVKKSKKLGMVLSATGICGLYLATMVNYISLRNFGGMAAVGIGTAISAAVFLYSRKRQWYFLRILGMCAGYITMLPVWREAGGGELLVLSCLLLLLNALCALIPFPQKWEEAGKIHILCSGAFSLLFLLLNTEMLRTPVYGSLLVLSAPLITNLVFYNMLKKRDADMLQRHGGIPESDMGLPMFFWIGMGMNLIGYCLLNLSWAADIYARGLFFAGLAVNCLFFFVIIGKRRERWFQYVIVMLGASASFLIRGTVPQNIIGLLALLLAAKLMGLIPEKSTRICDMILTVLTCVSCVRYVNTVYIFFLLGALAVSVCLIRYWQTAYELLIVWTFVFAAVRRVPAPLEPVAVFSILFVGILAFHRIPVLRGKGISLYNGTALAGMSLCLLSLVSKTYGADPFVYGILLTLGIAVIVLTFQEEYGMNFKSKNLILAAFLTYMVLVCRLEHPVWISILLMVVAVTSVALGFYRKDKPLRMYGLILAIFVCGKVTVYDFFGADTFHKMLLFFGVGVLALIISGIYIILEKKKGEAE